MSIKQKPISQCPTPSAWAEELERECIEPRWLLHLEQCTACQESLNQVAADSQLWAEAQETLADRPADLTHITASIVPLSIEPASNLINDPLCEYELAQLQRLLPRSKDFNDSGSCSLNSCPPCEPIARIGRYDLEQLVGRGGMGLVFRAWDTQLHRVVAVKTLAMSLWAMPSARERFIREGRAAAMLNHPNIVPMYDVMNDPPVPALVMQYIAGPTLDQWIHSHGPLDWSHALRIALQLSEALCAAHAEGLVHRDIKPGNVLLEADGTRALLTDFGLVRAMDDATLTQSGLLAGTPHFMSPEQAKSENVDGRSDLFSLGSLIYFAISGRTPFSGRESMSVLNSLCHARHVPLCQTVKEVPQEVSRFVDRLLQKRPQHRPTSSQDVRESLRRLLAAEHRLKTRHSKRSNTGRLLIFCAASLFALFLFSLPKLFAPSRVELAASVSGVTDRPIYVPPERHLAFERSVDNYSDMSMELPAESGANASGWIQQRMPAPNASKLDALAEETQLLSIEIDETKVAIDSRVGVSESLSTLLWEIEQELQQVEIGLSVPLTKPNEKQKSP